ncbi:hypothetical protein [Streptomyces sp. NPDC002133]|uniref:hypothetical protein n=1 Tax=Streptomyces sp. NPDC002133 TaxID=3154409 RepID=UPI0033190490
MPGQNQRKPATRKSILHRLKVPDGRQVELRELVRRQYLERPGYPARPFSREEFEGLLIIGGIPRDRAD